MLGLKCSKTLSWMAYFYGNTCLFNDKILYLSSLLTFCSIGFDKNFKTPKIRSSDYYLQLCSSYHKRHRITWDGCRPSYEWSLCTIQDSLDNNLLIQPSNLESLLVCLILKIYIGNVKDRTPITDAWSKYAIISPGDKQYKWSAPNCEVV